MTEFRDQQHPEEFEITEENFKEYFRDIRNSAPEKGDVIACYRAIAYFVDDAPKRNMIDLLRNTGKVLPAVQVMRKCFGAKEADSYRIPRMMVEDMLGGMSRDDVAKKEYKYTIEMCYYVRPEHIPQDNPHWSVISILNLEEHLAKQDRRIESEIVYPDEE
jgi:hypothetical protein